MRNLYIVMRFNKTPSARPTPRVVIHELTDWDGVRGDYDDGRWTCFNSNLNAVGDQGDSFAYGLVANVDDEADDQVVVKHALRVGLKAVEAYVKLEAERTRLALDGFRKLLDTDEQSDEEGQSCRT